MTNPNLDNSVENQRCILWQYDHALNLVGLIGKNGVWNKMAQAAVKKFWDYYRESVASIDTASTFGLNVWGRLLGIPRPTVAIESVKIPLGDELYRRLLKARFFLSLKKPTTPNYNEYLSILFPGYGIAEDGKTAAKIRCHVVDHYNMAISFTDVISASDEWYEENGSSYDEETALVMQHHDLVFVYPAGIRYRGDDGMNVLDGKVIGTDGQDLRNFADGFEMINDDVLYPKGGIVSEVSNANYETIGTL